MIKFDKELHLYFNEKGYIVPSTTEIISAVHGSGLENAPAELVARAAAKGTKIHAQIENYLNGREPVEPEPETRHFIAYCEKNFANRKNSKTEQILHGSTTYGEFCGTADWIVDGWLKDFKTSKTATGAQIAKWQMQLSFYFYAWKNSGAFQAMLDTGRVFKGLSVLHLTADGCEEIPLEYLGDNFVIETMRLYSEGKQAEKPAPATELQTVDTAAIAKFAETVKQIKMLEEQTAAIKEAIKAEMENRKILNLKIGDVNISYIAPTTRKSFDSVKFKKEHADLWPLYQKESAVAGCIRVKVD